MSTPTSTHFLQQTYLLATGRAASTATLTQLSALVQEEAGSFRLVAEPINRLFGSLAAAHGDAATLKSIAFNGLGLTLTHAQASVVYEQLFAAGINTWAKVFEFCIGMQNDIGRVLDNRADAAQGFNATLAATGKADLFSGATVNAAVANLLQNIGSSAASVSNGHAGLGMLASKLTSGGIISAVVDGYVAGATVFVDTNGDGRLSDGEYFTSTNANGNFLLPGDGEAGAVVTFGGVDLFTGKEFQGTLSAVAGATVLNPFTTLVHTLASAGYSASMAQAVSAVQTGLGLPAGINLLTYDAVAVLAKSTSSVSAKTQALFVQSVSLQLANVLTQLSATIDAANIAAGISEPAAPHVQAALAEALLAVTAPGKLDLTSAAVLTEIVKAAAWTSGAIPLVDVASQIALVMAASNASAAAATTPTLLSQAAVISQGAATDALASGASSGSFSSAITDFTGANLAALVQAATPGMIAPGVTTHMAWVPATPNLAFMVTEADGVVTFSGPATGDISVEWEGESGASVAIFSRAGAAANVTPDFSGTATATKVSLAAGQRLSGTVAELKGLAIEGAGSVVLTNSSASAGDLVAIDAASTLTVVATSISNITGTAAQLAALATSAGITRASNFAAQVDPGTATAADLKFIDTATTVAVNATLVSTITGSMSEVAAAIAATGITKSTAYAINVNDPAGTAMTISGLNALRSKTAGAVTVVNAVNITGTAADLTAAMVTAETLLAGSASITITGAMTMAQVNPIAAKTSGSVKATIVDTLAQLAGLADTNNAYTVTVTDAAGTAMTAWELVTLRGKTTGVVTVTNAVAITGTAAEVAAALLTAETLVIAANATVTIMGDVTVAQAKEIAAKTRGAVTASVTDTLANLATLEAGNVFTMMVTDAAGTEMKASALSALGGKTTGVVTVINAVSINGTATEVGAALLNADTLVVAATAAVTITTSVTAAQIDAIAATTSGTITATVNGTVVNGTISGTLANLATLTDAGSAYPITVTDIPGTTPLSALALSVLGGKTTGMVTVANAVTIAGTVAEVKAALVEADTLVVASRAAVTITGVVTVADANNIAAKTIGVVRATVADTLGNLDALSETSNVYTLTVTDPAGAYMAASALGTLGGKTTGVVTVSNAVLIYGTIDEVTAALVTADTLAVAGSANVTIIDSVPTMNASALKAIGEKTSGVVFIANPVTITGTATDVTAALVSAPTLVVANTAAVTITGAASVTQVNDIAARTSGVVTATLSDTLTNLGALADDTGNAYAITVTNATGSIVAGSALSALRNKTTGVITLKNAVNVTGTADEVIAALVSASPAPVVAGMAAVTVTGAATVGQLNDIAAATDGAVRATLSDTLANLAALTETGNIYTVTVTDLGGTMLDAAALGALGGKTTGVVTVMNEVSIIGTAAEVTAALVMPDTLVVAGTALVTINGGITVAQANAIAPKTTGLVTAAISDTLLATLVGLAETGNKYTVTVGNEAGSVLKASELSVLGGKTTGVVTVANAVVITGTPTEVTAALVASNTLVVAGSAAVTITGTLTVQQVKEIAAKTSGTVRATVSDKLANLLTLNEAGATDVYALNVVDAGVTTLSATDLSALRSLATTGEVKVSNAVTISGSAAQVKAALVDASTSVVAGSAKVLITGTATVDQANLIAAKTTGVVSATISDTSAATLAGLKETNNAFVTNIAAGQASAADIVAIDAATTVKVGAGAVSTLVGSQTDVTKVVTSTGITKGLSFAVTVLDSATVAQANVIDAANGGSVITAVISDGAADAVATLTGTGNAYTITLSGATATAAQLIAIDAKTTVTVDALAVGAITGTLANVATVINAPGVAISPNFNAVVTDSISVANANGLDALNGSGVISATISSGSAATLAALTANGAVNAYTTTVTAAVGELTDALYLQTIDNVTTVPVNASALTGISGTLSNVKALYESGVSGTISGLGNERVTTSSPASSTTSIAASVFTDVSYVHQQTTGAVHSVMTLPLLFANYQLNNLQSGDSFSTGLIFDAHASTIIRYFGENGNIDGKTWWLDQYGVLHMEVVANATAYIYCMVRLSYADGSPVLSVSETLSGQAWQFNIL
jgi:hypothetical protein